MYCVKGREMNGIARTRRAMLGLVANGTLAVAAPALLASCAWIGEGASGHAGRRPGAGALEPLHFDPADGLAAINATRRKFFLGEFAADQRLQLAAQTHADLMASTGNFGHEFGPETEFPKRISAAGFEGSAGENLGVGYGNIGEAIEGWLKSPRHREIMLRQRYDRAGIAYGFNHSGRNPKFTHFWVLIVGQEPPAGAGPAAMIKAT